jgi:CDP-diacylglycerol--glycerol-3-phosphate 3-phosphatidyltransferase
MQIESQIPKERIPWLMAGGRAVLGPVMILGEHARWNGITLAALIVAALLSDIFDGVLARRWKCDTAGVRLFDSMADIVFYAGCAIALWMRHPSVVRGFAVPIAAVVGLEALCLAVAFIKFGKLPSYHSYLAKAWGLVLASALVAAFVTKHPAGWIVTALVLGTLSNLEGLAMSLIMPVWRQDVKTLAVAWRLRRIAQRGGSRLIPKIAGAAVLVLAVAALPLHAQKSGEAIYETGTSQITANTAAPMIVTAEGLRFEAPTPLVIPYEKIAKVGFRKDVREHLGFFPAMFAGMFFARVHIYRVTLSYYDDAQKEHAAVFQVTRDDSITLSELLRARAPACNSVSNCKLPWDE